MDKLPNLPRKLQKSHVFAEQFGYNDYRTAKTIEESIVFAAKRQVWQQMILSVICAMLMAMNIWQNSHAVLLSRKAARRNAVRRFAVM